MCCWGKLLSINDTSGKNVGAINPFRYRGYYYDTETGLYYLQSRYYDPNTGRFLNADDTVDNGTSLLGHNMFAYCNNNPVNLADYDGNSPISCISYYFRCKTTIAILGSVYLTSKQYYLARDMFLHGMYGGGSTLPKYIKSNLISELKSSSVLKNKIKSYINAADKRGKSKFSSGNTSIQFSSGDLYYALQRVGINISGTKRRGKWYVSVKVWDTYDFTKFRKKLRFSNYANNLGLAMQKVGMMRPYSWSVSYTYYY